MDALAAAIGAIANKSTIPPWPVAALASWAAKAPATSTAEPAAAPPTESSGACSARTASAGAPWSTRNAPGLAFDARSWECTGGLDTQNRAAQPEIILAGLQPVAQRSIDQERFVGIPRRLRRSILRRRRGNLV